MTVSTPQTMTDKNIVDRSRTHKNAAVMKTVRNTREQLQHGREKLHGFDNEMLRLHINAVLQGAAAPPVLVILTAVGGLWFDDAVWLLAWALMTLVVYAGMIMVARRASREHSNDENFGRWRNRFLAAYTILGLTWAFFAYQDCTTCQGDTFVFYKSAVLLIALAATAMAAFALRRALYFAAVPVIAALALRAAVSQDMADVSILAMILAAALFFVFMSKRLYTTNVKMLGYQTEKDDLIAELEVANSVSDEARRRAEESNLAKSRFLASMSHELRTPLNAILGFSEVMSGEVLGPIENASYKEYVGDIHRSGQHLLNLINEILDLSRIEAGRYELNENALSLADIAEDCISLVQLKARSKNIRIIEAFEENLPMVWADEKSMRQVTLNLLSNAVKFTPSGGEIRVKLGWTAGGGQYLAIKDNGPGIAEEEIPVVLSAFGQGSVAIKSAEQGTGLGLPIVQAILAKHGGEFVLKSKLREGTEGIAILPAKRVLESMAPVEGLPSAAVKKKRAFS
ncbi:MAG: two-component sensor histidine kinase [Hoeflea sp.]|uniref:sensor histidine kinase n=1 Tax=Hoeflea sp. TaxID=1940281 RepID=UPI000C102017|nr:HAMP domain-containing sensor histidine kinase [Hoeflea sp.]PHR18326.1 MAG: two-component sensor histidine kinase [Hoeflea sp.]|tara:strand:- start:15996 stop:17537 length:1542 start_codon:yes stop_codon:yes gene_type:complete